MGAEEGRGVVGGARARAGELVTFWRIAPTSKPKLLPTMMQGMKSPPGIARPAAYDMNNR